MKVIRYTLREDEQLRAVFPLTEATEQINQAREQGATVHAYSPTSRDGSGMSVVYVRFGPDDSWTEDLTDVYETHSPSLYSA